MDKLPIGLVVGMSKLAVESSNIITLQSMPKLFSMSIISL